MLIKLLYCISLYIPVKVIHDGKYLFSNTASSCMYPETTHIEHSSYADLYKTLIKNKETSQAQRREQFLKEIRKYLMNTCSCVLYNLYIFVNILGGAAMLQMKIVDFLTNLWIHGLKKWKSIKSHEIKIKVILKIN